MLSLLDRDGGHEYPADYLLSRIRARRGALLPQKAETGHPRPKAEADDTGIWASAALERQWLFRQMNSGLRSVLAPLFVYFELNTLVRVLRFRSIDREREAEISLQGSVLAPAVKKILVGARNVSDMLTAFEEYCAETALPLEGLCSEYERDGLQRCEEMLHRRFLTKVLARDGHPDVLLFFQDIVAMRKILASARALRWNLAAVPSIVTGGEGLRRYSKSLATADGLARMVSRWTGGASLSGEQLHPSGLEPLLLVHLARKINRRRRAGGAVMVCIEYIWCNFMVARDRSLLFHAGREGASV